MALSHTIALIAAAALFAPAQVALAQSDAQPDAAAPDAAPAQAEKPSAGKPGAGKPSADKPAADRPGPDQPAVDEAKTTAADVAPVPQGPTPAWIPQTRREEELLALHGDFSIAVVGDELITRDAILAEMSRIEDPYKDNPEATEAERQEARFRLALVQGIEARLKVQGGRNQGYEPEMVAGMRDRYFDQTIKNWGGPSEARSRIANMGMTPEEFRGFLERRLLAQFWEDSVTGRSVGSAGRQYVDRTVRPGRLFSRYRAVVRDPDPRVNAIVGKFPHRTVLRRLLIDSEQLTSVEEAQRLAESLQESITSGILTFEKAYDQYGAFKGEDSLIRLPTDHLVRRMAEIHPGIDLEGFVRDAPIDAVSPVGRLDTEGLKPVFVLYQIVERIAATEATPFVDLALQTRLREAIQDEESKIRVARGLGELVQTTYVAPEDIRNLLLSRGRRQRRP